jgi:SAM-dependent methyltransferase
MIQAAAAAARAASPLAEQLEPSAADMAIEARFYDWQRAHWLHGSGDHVELYDVLARGRGGPVLELGCGTGSVAAELAVRGHHVVALDANPHALRAAERQLGSAGVESRVELVEGDMRAFDLERSFSLVVLDDDAFQRLLDAGAQRDCLDCVARHLSPGGRAVFQLSPFELAGETGEIFEHRVTDFFEGSAAVVAMYERIRQERALGLTHFDQRYVVFHPGVEPLTFETTLRLRTVHRFEMALLLETAGLRARVISGNDAEAGRHAGERAPFPAQTRVIIAERLG